MELPAGPHPLTTVPNAADNMHSTNLMVVSFERDGSTQEILRDPPAGCNL
jgi:hypothetical protein